MTLLRITRQLFSRLFIATALILTLTTCKEDKPIEPEGSNGGNNLASTTIGMNGGELKTENFSLSVPAGSFNSDVELSLTNTEEFDFFGSNCISEKFIIQGLPSDFSKTLRIAIKYQGTLNDSTYIALTSTTDESFVQDSMYYCEFFSVKDSSGFLVANFDNSILSNLLNKFRKISTDNRMEKIIISGAAITGMASYQSDYFNIVYPKTIGDDGRNFAEHMDDIFVIFLKDFSFDFKYNNSFDSFNLVNYSLETPFRFYVFDNSKTGIIGHTSPLDDQKARSAYLKFFAGGAQTLPSAKDQASLLMATNLITTLKETFNLNQEESKVRLSSALLWWFEDYLDIPSNNQPPVTLEGNELSLFGGFVYQTISPGLSSLIKYLVDFQNYNVSNFGQIFEEAHNNNKNHYVSLISKVDTLIMGWFPDYYEKYIKGEVYKIDGSSFLNQPGDFFQTWDVDSVTDTSKIFTANYNDLSAKRFIIELNHEFEDESTSLLLDACPSNAANNDGVATIVFGVDANDNLEHLVTARAEQIEIQNLKGYYQRGTKKFLVVVVNCINNGVDYTGLTEIDLKAEVRKDDDDDDDDNDGLYSITVNCGATIKYNFLITKNDGSSENSELTNYKRIWFMWEGNIENGIFNGIGLDDNEEITYSVSINFNNDLDTIKHISLSKIDEYNRDEFTGSNTYKIDLDNIAMTWSNDYGDKKWSYVDQSVCDYITFLDYFGETNHQNSDRHTSTLIEYSCETRAMFEVSCKKLSSP